jgi:hypothetical protein
MSPTTVATSATALRSITLTARKGITVSRPVTIQWRYGIAVVDDRRMPAGHPVSRSTRGVELSVGDAGPRAHLDT